MDEQVGCARWVRFPPLAREEKGGLVGYCSLGGGLDWVAGEVHALGVKGGYMLCYKQLAGGMRTWLVGWSRVKGVKWDWYWARTGE